MSRLRLRVSLTHIFEGSSGLHVWLTCFFFFADVEKLLTGLGAIKYGDSRLTQRHLDEDEPKQNGIRQGNRTTVEDDDSDWD